MKTEFDDGDGVRMTRTTLLQIPQFMGSVSRLKQEDPQRVSEAEQVVAVAVTVTVCDERVSTSLFEKQLKNVFYRGSNRSGSDSCHCGNDPARTSADIY